MSDGTFSIGDLKWSAQWGNLAIRYGASGEFKKVKADGKNDARQTWLGRENAQIKLTMICKDDKGDGIVDGEINNYVNEFVYQISPRGPNGGKAWAWSESRQRAFNVYDVTVENVSLDIAPGTGTMKLEVILSSWVKPAKTPIVTKTPVAAKPWSGPAKPVTPAPVKPGFSKTPVVVKP